MSDVIPKRARGIFLSNGSFVIVDEIEEIQRKAPSELCSKDNVDLLIRDACEKTRLETLEKCAQLALSYAPGCLGGVPIAAAIRRRAKPSDLWKHALTESLSPDQKRWADEYKRATAHKQHTDVEGVRASPKASVAEKNSDSGTKGEQEK